MNEPHPMTRPPSTTNQSLVPRWMLIVQIIYALTLVAGATMELLGTSAAPAELQRVLDQIHADRWVMRWVVFSNALHVLIAVGLLRGALGMRRGQARGVRLTRWSAWLMIGVTAAGQLVLATRLYPALPHAALPAGLDAGVLRVSMIVSAAGMVLVPIAALIVTRGLSADR